MLSDLRTVVDGLAGLDRSAREGIALRLVGSCGRRLDPLRGRWIAGEGAP